MVDVSIASVARQAREPRPWQARRRGVFVGFHPAVRRRHDPVIQAIPLGKRDSGGQRWKRKPSIIAIDRTRWVNPAASDKVELKHPCVLAAINAAAGSTGKSSGTTRLARRPQCLRHRLRVPPRSLWRTCCCGSDLHPDLPRPASEGASETLSDELDSS